MLRALARALCLIRAPFLVLSISFLFVLMPFSGSCRGTLTVCRLSVGIWMCVGVYSSSISQGLHILHTRHAQVEDLTWMTHNTYVTKKVILPLR